MRDENLATKTVAVLALLGAAVGLEVAVMMFGWGVQPQSWWWILGGGLVGRAAVKLLSESVAKS